MPSNDAKELANRIAIAVRDAVSDAEWSEILKRNAEDFEDSTSCASHDFVDTNEYAVAAFVELYGREPDFSADTELAHLTEALDIAHQQHFTGVR